mmetsp:Transcript_60279/g.112643  ORF Transcript_60279/g.112643 Transcript_60279/m.112643 type:complete len:94 (-) Transcript_60279:100-381(-)
MICAAVLWAALHEPAGQPASAAAHRVFVQAVTGHGGASSGQVGDGVDEGAAGLREVNPIERPSFSQTPFLRTFEDELVLEQLHLRRGGLLVLS